MKKLSTYLFLILFSFSAPSFADDIRDFQIEGISIGDSLLDFFSEEEIKNNIEYDYYSDKEDKTFVDLVIRKNFEYYDSLQITIKRSDTKYIVYAISGVISYGKNITECHKKLKIISNEIFSMFKNSEKNLNYKQVHPGDKTGKSTTLADSFFLDTGSVSVRCYDWSNAMTKKYNYVDHLSVAARTNEFNNWLK